MSWLASLRENKIGAQNLKHYGGDTSFSTLAIYLLKMVISKIDQVYTYLIKKEEGKEVPREKDSNCSLEDACLSVLIAATKIFQLV